VTDFGEHALLAGVWFDVLAVRAEESELDIALPLSAGALVDQRDATLLEEFQQTAEVLHGAREAVKFGNDHPVNFPAVHQGEQPL
jgi:hypothetical protein